MKVSSLSAGAVMEIAIVLCLLVHTGLAIKCHNCSTLDDPRCNDPFDKEKNKDMLVDCEQWRSDAKFCRKIDQTVDGDHRVFRRCAWEDHKRYDCYFGTSQYYKSQVCLCRDDGCNSAPGGGRHSFWAVALFTTLAAIIRGFALF